jgi:hypothetical protein
MGNFIVVQEREVKAKGLNKEDKIDLHKLEEYVFEEDLQRLEKISKLEVPKINTDKPTLFYPGSGIDLFFPLFYVKELFEVKEINLIFLDEQEIKGMIKTILDDIGVSFSEEHNLIRFYWKNTLVNLSIIHSKVQAIMDNLPAYDIYFERAFRIMRDNIPDYEQTIIAGLSDGGILISDTGFEKQKLEYIDVPKELSSYGEMVMGRKK